MNIIPPKVDSQEEFSQLIAIDDVAKQLSVSHKTLQRWDKKGKLKAIRLIPNGKRLYKKSDLEMLIKPKTFSAERESNKLQAGCIALKEFGTFLDSQEDGKKAWIKIQPFLETIDTTGKLEIDFADIMSLGAEWAEAFLVPLHQRYGDRLIFMNVEDLSHVSILEISGLYRDPHRTYYNDHG